MAFGRNKPHTPRSQVADTWLEPSAALGDPATHSKDRDGCSQRPPKWQNEISDQAQENESAPEDLSLHLVIVARRQREETGRPGYSQGTRFCTGRDKKTFERGLTRIRNRVYSLIGLRDRA